MSLTKNLTSYLLTASVPTVWARRRPTSEASELEPSTAARTGIASFLNENDDEPVVVELMEAEQETFAFGYVPDKRKNLQYLAVF